MWVFASILSIFGLAIFAPFIYKVTGKFTGWVLATVPAAAFAFFATLLPSISEGEHFSYQYEWVPSLDINLWFYVDGLSLLMALLVTGVGALIIIYAGGYLAHDKNVQRFYPTMLIFMGAMLGLVLADNLILLFIFWELTSISSYMLIGYYHGKAYSRDSARQALLVTGSGGLALLVGLILLGNIGGSWQLSELLGEGALVREHALYLPILILVFVGCFTKSAQFPFHFWLPNAMAAPTPVSAYLHSATMVKAGVYLLARLTPVLGGTDVWMYTLTIVGGITAVLGAWLSLQKYDLKQIMAYSTISALGKLVFLIGLGSAEAMLVVAAFLLTHSLYKAGLFMVAGAVDHEAGTRDVRQLGGLVRALPLTTLGVVLAGMSLAGLPPLFGFVSKELIYEATLHASFWSWARTITVLIVNVLLVASATIIVLRPFLMGKLTAPKHHIHRAPMSLWLGPVLLGALALVFGLMPELVNEWILTPAGEAIAGEPFHEHYHLHALPTKINTVVILSLVTFALGFGLYAVRRFVIAPAQAADARLSRGGPERIYEWFVEEMQTSARRITLFLQNGSLSTYLLVVVAFTILLLGYMLVGRQAFSFPPFARQGLGVQEISILGLMVASSLIVVTSQSRLKSIVALGVVGYGMALIFIMFGAPDLAMTQFSIETLSVVVFMLVLYRLPVLARLTSRRVRGFDWIVSGGVGVVMALFALAVTALPAETPLSDYFAQNSYILAKGHNIVNVILVDFRGFDTLGEITVLAIASIGVFALLKLRPQANDKFAAAQASQTDEQDPV